MTASESPPARPCPADVAADLDRLAILVAHGMSRPGDARRLVRAAAEIRRLADELARVGGGMGDGAAEAERLLGAWRAAGI